MRRTITALICTVLLSGRLQNAATIEVDPVIASMSAELARARTLQLNSLDKPYFIQYAVSDTDERRVSASLGGLIVSNAAKFRIPRIDLRVGNYNFDNTNSVYSRTQRVGLLPVDNDSLAIREGLWLATDAIYKLATDQITRKRSILREVASPDQTPDFAPQKPTLLREPETELHFDRQYWEKTLRSLSAEMTAHPRVLTSGVDVLALASSYRLVNSEGTVVRIPQDVTNLSIEASGLAPDGSRVWDAVRFTSLHLSQVPPENVLRREVQQVASDVERLEAAPVLDDYNGPVLFEKEAAAQIVAEVLTDAVRLQRKPLAPANSNASSPPESVWAARLNGKVAPDWVTIYDDPQQESWQGRELAGTYRVDDEGVPGARTVLVENGTFKSFLLSRTPVRTFNASNGHGRLAAGFGGELPVIGNMFVRAAETVPEGEMKQRLLQRVKTAAIPFGIVIRRLDFPSSASSTDLQGLARDMQREGYARTVSAPVLIYRVYPDGHEELVRGARFREFSAKNLRDIALASDTPYVLNYVNNGTAFDFAGSASEFTTSSVICPSLLIDGVELGRAQHEGEKPPMVPPPALVPAAATVRAR